MTERASWDVLLGWVDDGQARAEQVAAGLDDAQLGAPSVLDGWTRGHVLSHLSRNADALTNLLHWARTGVETPMYPSQAARSEGIDAGAGNPLRMQLADLAESGARLREAARSLPEDRRTAAIRSAQGRDITALDVPWMRNRELWLHLVDLDAGFTMNDIPAAVARDLVADVAGWMSSRVDTTADLLVDGTGAPIRLGGGTAATSVISGPAQQLAGWLTGRLDPEQLSSTGPFPLLPPWL